MAPRKRTTRRVTALRKVVSLPVVVGVLLTSIGFVAAAGNAQAHSEDIDCSVGVRAVVMSEINDLRHACHVERITGDCADESGSITSFARSVHAAEVYSSVPVGAEIQVEILEESSVHPCGATDCFVHGETTLSTARFLSEVCAYNTTTGSCSDRVIESVLFDDPGHEADPSTTVEIATSRLGSACYFFATEPIPIPDSGEENRDLQDVEDLESSNASGATGGTGAATTSPATTAAATATATPTAIPSPTPTPAPTAMATAATPAATTPADTAIPTAIPTATAIPVILVTSAPASGVTAGPHLTMATDPITTTSLVISFTG